MSASHWSRRQFVGTALTTSVVAMGGGVVPAFGATRSLHRFVLVQSTALPIDAARANDDLERNLTRILQIIEHQAKAGDWIAFDDAPLTGHSVSPLAAADISLGDEDLAKLASAARRHQCWISLGAVRSERDTILLLSPNSELQEWSMPARRAPFPLQKQTLGSSDLLPIATLNQRRIALAPMDASDEVVAEYVNRAVDILITMGSGSGCLAPRASPLARSLSLQVHAAAPWQPPGCNTEGLGRSRALNAQGKVIAECPTADEHVLVLAGL